MKSPKNGPKTPKNRAKSPKKKPKRRRKLPALYAGNDRRDEKFLDFLDSGDQELTVYIYRSKDHRPIGSHICQCYLFRELEDFIRDEFGGGEYAIMIRRNGGAMLFSAVVSIGVPLNWQPPG